MKFIPVDQVAVVNIGGTGNTNAQETNGMCHITEQALGLLPDTQIPFINCGVYSLTQSQQVMQAAKFDLFKSLNVLDETQYNTGFLQTMQRVYEKSRARAAMDELFEHLIRDRIRDQDHHGIQYRLSKAEAIYRMRRLILVCYSNGTCVAERLRQKAMVEMAKLNYTNDEIKNILRHVFVFNAGTTRPLGLEMNDPQQAAEGRFTNVHFLSRSDAAIFEGYKSNTVNAQIGLRQSEKDLVYMRMAPTEHVFVVPKQCMNAPERMEQEGEHAVSNYFSGAYQYRYGRKTAAAQESTMLFTRLLQNVVSDALENVFNADLILLSKQRRNADGIPSLNYEQGPASYCSQKTSENEKRQNKYNPYCVGIVPDLEAFLIDAKIHGDKELDLIKAEPILIQRAPYKRKRKYARALRQAVNAMG